MDSGDLEAAPTSKLLTMSGSTTTTTLASNNSNNASHIANNLNSIKLDEFSSSTTVKQGRAKNIYGINDSYAADDANISDSEISVPDKNKTTRLLKAMSNQSEAEAENDTQNYDENNPALMGAGKEESNLVAGLKLLAIFSTLYFFMWSSSILSQAFNLASYHYAGHFIRTSGFLQNPLIGLMVGVITTVVFQSSGAVTSVLVTIVGSGVLTVRQSIPIIMGANLGTSVTNTVVSLIVYRRKENFEVAMTAGIVHDMYNMMSVVFLLPVELLLHPLEYSSDWMLNLVGTNSHSEIGELQFLSYLVKPLIDIIIMIDKEKTNNLDPNVIVPSDVSLVKRCCNSERRGNETICHEKCLSLFSKLDLSDNVVCILLLTIAMVTLFTCLVFVVKVTKSLLG